MKSKSGKALLRKRGEHLERSFCHVLDHGSLRRATLRGLDNLTKRQLGGALAFNLSLLMRHLTGYGTPKQRLAAACAVMARALAALRAWIDRQIAPAAVGNGAARIVSRLPEACRMILRRNQMAGFSTGC